MKHIALLLAIMCGLSPVAALAQVATPVVCVPVYVQGNLRLGMQSESVRNLQKILNSQTDTRVAQSGAGSPGNETTYFGPATQRAVIAFQQKYASEVLTPAGLKAGTGFVGSFSIAKLNALNVGCAVANPPTPQYPTPTPTPPINTPSGVSVTSVQIATVGSKKMITVNGSGFATTAPGNSVVFDDILLAAGFVVSNNGTSLTFELGDGFGAFCDCPPNMACACPMIYYMRDKVTYKLKIKNHVTHTFSNEIVVNLTN